ncbi:MAG: ABC transporter ATP-binding protein [Phycisphaerae bacterium]|jgi:phospholipid/cholesterol/gamma-HCH transport system ATP-binding protein
MSDREPIIRLVNVSKSFGKQAVLKGVNLSVFPGQTTVIIGPSGCGKSVLLKHIVGLIQPDSGKVFFGDQEVSALGDKEMAPIRRQIGFLFQGSALFDSMTVEDNVRFPLEENDAFPSREAATARCKQVLSLVGLDGTQQKFPEELSGGQKKRVALARAIALDPKVILYDEPTTGLDPIRADLINELILKLQSALGTTAVVVTHDMASARKIGDRILMLHDGRFIADAAPGEMDKITDTIVARFVQGRASEEELAQLRTGHLENVMNHDPDPGQAERHS